MAIPINPHNDIIVIDTTAAIHAIKIELNTCLVDAYLVFSQIFAKKDTMSECPSDLPKLEISLASFCCTDGSDEDDDACGKGPSSMCCRCCCCCSTHEPCSICTNNAGHIFINAAGVI